MQAAGVSDDRRQLFLTQQSRRAFRQLNGEEVDLVVPAKQRRTRSPASNRSSAFSHSSASSRSPTPNQAGDHPADQAVPADEQAARDVSPSS